MAQRHLEQKIKDSHFEARNRDEDRPAMGALSKEKVKKKPKNNSERGDCIRWTTKNQYSFGEACAFKHAPKKKGKGKGRPRSLVQTGSPHRSSKGDGKGSVDESAEDIPTSTVQSLSGKANKLSCTNFKKGSCHMGH